MRAPSVAGMLAGEGCEHHSAGEAGCQARIPCVAVDGLVRPTSPRIAPAPISKGLFVWGNRPEHIHTPQLAISALASSRTTTHGRAHSS